MRLDCLRCSYDAVWTSDRVNFQTGRDQSSDWLRPVVDRRRASKTNFATIQHVKSQSQRIVEDEKDAIGHSRDATQFCETDWDQSYKPSVLTESHIYAYI